MQRWFWSLSAIPIALWLISMQPLGGPGSDFWTLRGNSIILSGIVAYSMMAIAVLLATRPVWLERYLGGLDHGYRLHKWLGIGSAALVFMHWMMEIVPKSMAKAGWLTRPAKSGGKGPEPLFAFFRDPAKDLGEWLGYIAIALVIMALIKFFPYHWFRRVHKVFPVVFLVATFHGIVLLPDHLWPTITGVWVGAWAIVGSVSSLLILFGRTNRNRRHVARVKNIVRHPDGIMEVTCRLDTGTLQFKPGQFAFVRFENTKDPHPFSISSPGTDPKNIRFCIKALGDDTRMLLQSLKEGSLVQLEGPYGMFDFASPSEKQIWVGGGVGVAPFMSRLEQMASRPVDQREIHPVNFFFCTPENAAINQRVIDLCQQTGVKLHLIHQNRDGNLDLEKIQSAAGELKNSSLWFCGPLGLGNHLHQSWSAQGLADKFFHRELFVMR